MLVRKQADIASDNGGQTTGSRAVYSLRVILALVLLTAVGIAAYAASIPQAAHADVDMTGRLEKIHTPKHPSGKVKSYATTANGDYRCVDEYSVVANGPYFFAIGNCRAGWELEAVSYASENSKTHEHSYGGFVNNAFSGCGWIDTRYPVEKLNTDSNSACAGSGSGREFKVEESTFMERHNGGTTGDGYPVVNKVPCSEYANYRPWSSSNVEKELIRTVPEYASSSSGSNYPALKWRYITKYASTDGTGKYVMVRDDRITGAGEGNWVFVPRSCLPATLPENENERVPPLPIATTGEYTNVTYTSAGLAGSINPSGVDTHYYIEWGKEASKPYEGFAPTPYPGEDVGAGTEVVNKSVTATGLKPNTVYYYRLVAKSGVGTSEGALKSFATPPEPPVVTTEHASSVQFHQGTVNGKVNPNGAATEYYYQYGITNAYGSETSKSSAGSGSTAVSAPVVVIGLSAGATYHFRLVANNSGGTSYGADETFTTAALPVLSFGHPSQSSISLTWTGSANATSYTVKRDGAVVASTSELTYLDTKLQPSTFYTYEIVANEASESGSSNTAARATTPLNTVKADINGDAKTDLAYIYPGGYIDTFSSQGNGTFEEAVETLGSEFETTQGLWLTGDFNDDGKSDLVYIYPGGYIDTFLSKGNGTYEEKSELIEKGFNDTDGTWEVGDVNGDGKADLIYILPGGYTDTFLSKGDGTYEETIEHREGFDSTPGQWLVGDFNDDGKADLAYIYPGGDIDTFLSKGNGTYEEKSELIEKEFNTVSGQWLTGDFNDDGKADLVYIYPGGYIDSFFSKGNGSYEEFVEHLKEFDSTSGRWRTGDVNGDGKTDLMYTYPGGYIDTFLSKGNGTYEGLSEFLKEFDTMTGLWL